MATGNVNSQDPDDSSKAGTTHSNLPPPSTYSPEKQEKYDKYLGSLKEDFRSKWAEKPVSTIGIKDFTVISTLGIGAFGVVHLVQLKSSKQYFAMKSMVKHKIIKHNQIEHTLNERKVLQSIKFPFVVNLECFFKDNSHLYMVLPFVVGGELFKYLRQYGRFGENLTKFCASQVILALEYLHSCDLIYRDLKPENILFEKNGYIKITDFGFCKILKDRTWTFCGTPDYIAPEIILHKGYGMSADWWSLGVLLFEMAAGRAPFSAHQVMRTYEKIVTLRYQCPHHFSSNLKNIINNTLQLDISRRYGVMKAGVSDFKLHPWFHDMDWEMIFNRRYISPLIPKYKTDWDTSNFDTSNIVEMPAVSTCLYEKEFMDF